MQFSVGQEAGQTCEHGPWSGEEQRDVAPGVSGRVKDMHSQPGKFPTVSVSQRYLGKAMVPVTTAGQTCKSSPWSGEGQRDVLLRVARI